MDHNFLVHCHYLLKFCLLTILADCKFLHPASRSFGKAKKPLQSSHTHPGNAAIGIAGGMSKSKKFGANGKQAGLNPDAVEFEPTGQDEGKNATNLNVTL